MSKITVEQVSELFEQVKADRITRENLQAFLRNPNSIFGGDILTIDRSKPFNPRKFIGLGWKIEEEDERSLTLATVNIADIMLETTLKASDNGRVQGEEKVHRLKASDAIRLDAKVFQTFWENKHLIPESWKGKCVCFAGTILRDPYGSSRDVLCLCWDGGRWDWYCHWLGCDWRADLPSAVLAK